MKHRIAHAVQNVWFAPLLGGLIGMMIFLLTFGVQVVIPTNVDWLLAGGDLSQHYIGWQFFRQSDWTFPIGVASDLAYPHGLAITFMDSLPLFAIPSKLISGLLPEQFQYFGIWGLMSYALVGIFAALIVRRFTGNVWVITLASLFLCLSPIVLQRMFTHTALAGQWIILAGIYAALRSREWRLRMFVGVWSLLLSVAVLIHPYFLPMMVFIMTIAIVIRYKRSLRSVLELVLPVIAAAITTWLIGGFTFTTISGQNFGGAGYDIAAPFLPSGWSVLDLGLPQLRFEMFAYLGIGGILLIAAAILLLAKHREKVWSVINRHRAKAIAAVLVLATLLAVAIGPKVTFAGMLLFSYEVPSIVEKAWGIFRVTARLAWPLWYGLVIIALILLLRFMKLRVTIIILAIACALQAIDIGFSPQFSSHTKRFHHVAVTKYESELTDSAWIQLSQGKKHIVYLGDLYDGKFVTIAQYALQHKLTLNTGYFARKPTLAIEQTVYEARQDLVKGAINSETLYIYDQPIEAAAGHKQKELNGYFVISN